MNIERLLSENLRPVSAPPRLWARVALPGEHPPQSPYVARRLAWCLTAALILLMAVWGFRARGAGSQPAFARTSRTATVELALRIGDQPTCLRCHLN
jgi:hypothetical protein